MNFSVLVKLKGTVSGRYDSLIYKRIGRFPKTIDMSGTLKKKIIKIYFDVVNMSRW